LFHLPALSTIFNFQFILQILYADLIRVAAMPNGADVYFLAWTVFAITFFAAEIILSSLARPGYFLKFYFWMDVVASISLLCDIPGFMDLVSPSNDEDNRHVTLDRAAKAAQAGARSARIMQVIAVAQLLRYKAQRLAQSGGRSRMTEEGSTTSSTDGSDATANGVSQMSKPQSRVGEKVTEMTMRKVILGVLLLLLVLPVFDANVLYGQPTYLEDGGLVMLHDQYLLEGNTTGFYTSLQAYIEENIYKMGTKETGFLYKLVIANQTWLQTIPEPDLRDEEKQTSTVKTAQCDTTTGPWDQCYESKAWVNVKWAVQMQACLDIGRITFILSMLSVGALLFIRDTDALVLQPIERMMEKVKSVSENPLAAHSAAAAATKNKGSSSGKQLETRVLEHSIAKICSLLSVGFGEAGAEVIADNIKSGGDLNPMIPGRKVRAIFGFCDIRSFTDATEVLQEEVMEFVNSIANIVHTEVSLHGGAANKNIGDAFLLVWKLPGSAGMTRDRSSRSSVIGAKKAAGLDDDDSTVTHLADAALASFLVIQAALKRSKKLQGYGAREDLNARMPNFSVKMGFGLHVGWAIEGAIGSRYKIDASYLSPHVNMAARLEAATKQFGVPLLLSNAFVSLLSPAVRKRVREIDCVTVKGSNQPIGLYTMDIDADKAATSASGDGSSAAHPNNRDVLHAPTLTTSKSKKGRGDEITPSRGNFPPKTDHITFSDYPYFDEFEEHPDIVATKAVDDTFLNRFAEGFDAYKAGDWPRAAAVFEETRTVRRDGAGEVVIDGPSEALLAVIREKGGVAPAGWEGYRELTEK
jgi:class 3 adenylate cyclase